MAMAYALFGCNALMGLVFFLRYQTLPPQIPLFFSHTPGEDQLGEVWMLFFLPFFMNLFVLLNSFIARRFFPGNAYVGRVLRYLNIVLMAAFTVIFIRIILLVS